MCHVARCAGVRIFNDIGRRGEPARRNDPNNAVSAGREGPNGVLRPSPRMEAFVRRFSNSGCGSADLCARGGAGDGRLKRGALVRSAGWCVGIAALLVPAWMSTHVRAQGVAEPIVAPELPGGQPEARPDGGEGDWREELLAPSVALLLKAEYLSDAERSALRVKHGVWREADLATPALRAAAALTAGRVWDAALSDPGADVDDRAEAALVRGEPEAAIALLEKRESVRSLRVRAAAHAELGEREKAVALLTPIRDRYRNEVFERADDLVDAVRAVALLIEIVGAEDAAADFQEMMGVLARVRTEMDPQSWRASLAEAELLYSKDNMGEAAEAAQSAVQLNPSAAEAWALLGQIAVDQFDADQVRSMAENLDQLASGAVPGRRKAEGEGAAELPRSPLGAIIEARMALRQSDGAGALEAVNAAMELTPRMRALLAMRAAAVAGTFAFDSAKAHLDELDRLSPGTAEGYLAVGRALSEMRQYAEAAKFLNIAAERAPHGPEAFIELGLMELQSGRDEEAELALTRAVELDPFHVRAGNSLELVKELRTYATVESEHFIVRYNAEQDSVLASEMLAPLEEIFVRVTGAERGGIDHKPAGKTIIELLPDHRWFAVRITGMPAIHTIAASTGPVIAMESPRAGPNSFTGAYDWIRVVRHEYVHTVTLSRTRNRLPHWFTEASAVYLEDAPRDWSKWEMLAGALRNDALFDLQKINVAFIRPERPTDRPLAYAQGHWMYEFMIERFGDRAPLELMDKYAAGVREDEAMRRVLGVGGEEFLKQFKAWGAEQLVAVGVNPKAGEPTLRELYDATKAEAAKKSADAASDPDAAAGAGPEHAAKGEPGVKLPEGMPMIVGAEQPVDEGPTRAMVDGWLAKHPEHPQVLELAVRLAVRENEGKPSAEMIPLLKRYAGARPVDPLPHRLLARLYLDGTEPGPAAAIPHLEFLDVREQSTNAFAMELARRYAATGDWTRAGASAERATRISPYDPAARELAATVAVKRAMLNDAERHIVALTKIEPERELHKSRLSALRERMKSN
jgi:cellulose synthase operon protein C